MKNYLCIILLMFLFSCKAVERYKASSKFPADCAKAFPIKTDTVRIPGRVDTLPGVVVDCDSVSAEYEAWWRARQLHTIDTLWLEKFKPSKVVKCPPSFRVVDTVVMTVENTAHKASLERTIFSLNSELTNSQNEAAKWRNKARKRLNWCAALLACLVGVVAFAAFFRRKQNRGYKNMPGH